MKLSTDLSPTEIGGAVGTPQAFAIAASKEAFKILSSGLYNNKKLAIVRELSCNAYDAHVAAGKKDVPFEVHLPTSFEPFFSVKDYGVGLSHDEVTQLYCTYFSTNKSQSNDYVGALGLGSKSPFCYTEGFTVVSRYNGKIRIYSAFINEQGMPTIVLQTEDDTEDSNGLEVSFPVKQEDCWEFENQAKAALEFFNPVPILNVAIDVKKTDYVMRNEKWGLRKQESSIYHSKKNLRAIQGMVPYNIGTIDVSRLSEKQSQLLELPLDIFFPIGELSVAASREMLSNDERTIGNILKALDKIHIGLVEDMKKQVAACSSAWEARLLIFNMVNTYGLGGIANRALNSGFFDGTYEKFTLKGKDPILNHLDYEYVIITQFQRVSTYQNASKYNISLKPDEKKQKQARNETRDHYEFIIPVNKDGIAICINDLGFGGQSYLNYYLQESNDSRTEKINRVYLVHRANKDISNDLVVRQGKKFVEELGKPPVMLLSNLRLKYQQEMDKNKVKPVPAAKKEIVSFSLTANVSRHREGYQVRAWGMGWIPNVIPLQGRHFYVLVKNQVAQYQGKDFFDYAEDFQDFVEAAINSNLLGIAKTDLVYGIPETSHLVKNPNWVELTGYLFTQLKQVLTPQKELELSLVLKPFDSDYNGILQSIAKKRLLGKDSTMQKFCNKLADAQKLNTSEINALSVVIKVAEKLEILKVKNVTDFNKEWKEVEKTYPMLTLTSRYYGGDLKTSMVVDYCKLVDAEIERRALKALEIQSKVVYSIEEEVHVEGNTVRA